MATVDHQSKVQSSDREVFKHAHSKFTVYGHKPASIHVHVRKAVMLASIYFAQAHPNKPPILVAKSNRRKGGRNVKYGNSEKKNVLQNEVHQIARVEG